MSFNVDFVKFHDQVMSFVVIDDISFTLCDYLRFYLTQNISFIIQKFVKPFPTLTNLNNICIPVYCILYWNKLRFADLLLSYGNVDKFIKPYLFMPKGKL